MNDYTGSDTSSPDRTADHAISVRRWTPGGIAVLYAILALIASTALNFAFPAFHAPDDYDHVKRASTLLTGQLHPLTVPGRSSGAAVDTGLLAYVDAQTPLVSISDRPLADGQRAALNTAETIRWSNRTGFSEAPGAMSYFPALYLPQAMMLWVGKTTGSSIATSVLLARLANSLTAIALAFLGLRGLPRGGGLIAVMLLLPKSLIQLASNSADPILFGIAVILVSAIVRSASVRNMRTGIDVCIAVLGFIGMAVRPPLAAMMLAFCVRAIGNRAWIAAGLGIAAILGALLWFAATIPAIVDLRCGIMGAPSAKILKFAVGWPSLILHSIAAHYRYYAASFIGEFGWGSGPHSHIEKRLPGWAYLAAIAVLLAAIAREYAIPRLLDARTRLLLAAAALLYALIVFYAMYTACTDPTRPDIAGVQGRYFVPSFIALSPALGAAWCGRRRWQHGQLLDRLFPVLLMTWSAANLAMILSQGHLLYALS